IVKIVKCWSGLLDATNCTAENLQTSLPSYDASAKPSTCGAEAYPWGQSESPTTTSTTPKGSQGSTGSTGGGASAASFSALAIVGSFFMAALLR
ncbi:hypothetical protein AAVH_30575, partial [Aphelenchoides avenae]